MAAAPVPVLRDRARERAADHAAERDVGAAGAIASRVPAPVGLGLGQGARLPAREQGYFEKRLGADLSGVRVHVGASAAARLGARAFAAGRDIGFAPGAWQPGSAEGRRLLGHELAHVVQQGAHGPAVQLEDAPAPAEASDAMTEGLKTVVEQAKENEGVKTLAIDPAKRYALGQWDRLGTGDKAGLIGFGAAAYGIGLGGALGNPEGRKLLSDVNLVAPLALIPYSTLTGFRYVQPEGGVGPTLFKATFSGDDLLGLAHRKSSYVPPMTLSFDMTWSLDPSGGARLSAAKAVWGVMPGVKLQAGSGVGLDWKPTIAGPDGQISTIMKSVPAVPGTPAVPGGVGVFLSVDLLQAPFVPRAVREALGAAPDKK
jgi:hypothetical protein